MGNNNEVLRECKQVECQQGDLIEYPILKIDGRRLGSKLYIISHDGYQEMINKKCHNSFIIEYIVLIIKKHCMQQWSVSMNNKTLTWTDFSELPQSNWFAFEAA